MHICNELKVSEIEFCSAVPLLQNGHLQAQFKLAVDQMDKEKAKAIQTTNIVLVIRGGCHIMLSN